MRKEEDHRFMGLSKEDEGLYMCSSEKRHRWWLMSMYGCGLEAVAVIQGQDCSDADVDAQPHSLF